MTAYLNALASYLPKLLVERANDGRINGLEPSSEEFQAALLFADVSGFTRLTEKLTARGPAGTEHLTQVLNLYFGQIIDLVDQWGGDVIKFAGDAMIALWLNPEGAKEATACALALQRRLHDHDMGDGLHLSMKVAVGAGTVSFAQLGGIFDRWEFLVCGSPLDQVGIANGLAVPGDVVISSAVLDLIGSRSRRSSGNDGADALGLSLEPVGDEMHRVIAPLGMDPPEKVPMAVRPSAAATLRRYIPGAIRSRLDANQSDWLGEQRRLSVIFINLPDFNAQTPLLEADRTMKALQIALYRFEGSVNKISVDDKGASLIAVLGLPPLGHPDDPERAVRAALAMQRVLSEAGHHSSIGVTTGLAFCGTIGNARRREYTVMGNVVNLSARLMQAAKAPGHSGLLCDEPTWSASRQRLRFERLAAISVKGRSEAISVFRPIVEDAEVAGFKSQLDSDLDLPPKVAIGREAEIEKLTAFFNGCKRSRSGGLMVVRADHGMGKAQLLQSVARRASDSGFQVWTGHGHSIDQQTPYRVWRSIFEQIFKTEMGLSDQVARRYAILAALPDDPQVLEVAPLLDAVLPLGWEDTELSRRLSGDARADRTRRLLAAVLSSKLTNADGLIVLHEAQWIDSASAALMQCVLSERVKPVLLVSVTPEGGDGVQWVADLAGASSAQLLELGPLTPDAIIEVACVSLGVDALPELAARLIVERAEGAPLFAEEIAIALSNDGLIDISDRTARWTGGDDLGAIRLPDTIEGLITARIDRLLPDEQLTIKVASVIGSYFESQTLAAIHPIQSDHPVVEEQCEIFDQVLLTSRVHDAFQRGLQYRFRSELLLKVIYNMMLFSQRRDLHQSLAEQYEREGVALDPAMAPTLAFHWDRATQDRAARPACAQKAVHYYLVSGRQAVSAAASREAESAFRRALSLLPQVPDGDEKASDTIELQLGLGALRMATHGWDDQEVAELFESAQTLCRRQGRSDPLFRILRGQWQLAIGVADYDRAYALASQLVQLAGSAELSREALRALGTTHFWRGEFSAARDELRRALEIQHAADSSAVSLVQDTEVALRAILAWVHAFLGDAAAANQEAGAATMLAHEGLPPFSRAFAWGGAMWTGFYLNDPATARSAAVITRDFSLERGFDYLATAAHVVHGWARTAQGDVEGIHEVDAAIASWRKAGKAIGLPVFLVVLAKSHLLVGSASKAHAVLEDAALIRGLERELWLRPLVLGVREELARQLP